MQPTAHIHPRRITPPEYVCRDTGTRQAIARGTLRECRAFAAAFGFCYIEKT